MPSADTMTAEDEALRQTRLSKFGWDVERYSRPVTGSEVGVQDVGGELP